MVCSFAMVGGSERESAPRRCAEMVNREKGERAGEREEE
jgi:hypothetical protein